MHNVKTVGLDAHVLGFTMVVSLMTGIIFGLAPALRESKCDLNESLRDSGRGMSPGLRHQRLRNVFVVVEIALALALLAGGGLLIKSFWRLRQISPGFDPQRVLTLRLNLPQTRYAGAQQQNAFTAQILERLTMLPGVKAVGATTELPFTGSRTGSSFAIEGRAPLPRGQSLNADNRAISADYFRAMGIPLRRGRGFTAYDNAESPRVAIINEQAARRFFRNEDPIGKWLIMRGADKFEIVGVAGDVKHGTLTEETRPEIYMHAPQVSLRAWMDVAVRTVGDPESLTASVRGAIRAVDPDQPVYDVRTMEQRLAGSIATSRFNAMLLGLFATAAMILAAGGVYGVMSYTVTQRTSEIGVRIALGAEARDVLHLIVKQGMDLTFVGIIIGLMLALAVTRLLASLLYGVRATDPAIFAGVMLFLIGVALLACYLPARKATKIDPMTALRHE